MKNIPLNNKMNSAEAAPKHNKPKLSDSAEQLRFLNTLSHELLANSDIEKGIHNVLNMLLNYFHANRAYIFEFDFNHFTISNTYEVCARGITEEKTNLQNVPLSTISTWLKAFENNSYYSIDDVDSLDDSRIDERIKLQQQKIKSLFVVPLYRDAKLIGMIGIDDPGTQHLQVKYLVTLGDYLAVMLTRRDLNAKVKRDHDDLLSIRKRLENLVDGIPGGIGIYEYYNDGFLKVIYMNEGFYSMLGIPHEHRNGSPDSSIISLIHPDDIGDFYIDIALAIRENRLFAKDVRFLTGSGRYRWLSARGRIAETQSNKTIIYVSYTDIDDAKNTQLKLEASYRAIELAGREASITMWLYNLDTKQISHVFAESPLFGFKRTVDNVPANLLNDVSPESRAEFQRIYDDLFNGATQSEAIVKVKNLTTGQFEWQHVVYIRFRDKYFTERMAIGLCINVDIQQELSEHYMRELQLRHEMVRDSIAYYGLNLTTGKVEEYQSRKPYSLDIRENANVNDILGSELTKNVVPEDYDIVRNTFSSSALLEAYSNNETSASIVYRQIFPKLGIRWVKTMYTLIRRPGSNDIVAFIYIRDIDNDKKNQLALEMITDEEIESIQIVNTGTGLSRFVKNRKALLGIEKGSLINYNDYCKKFCKTIICKDDRQIFLDTMMLDRLMEKLNSSPLITLAYSTDYLSDRPQRKRTLAMYMDDTHENIVISRRDITELYEDEQRQKKILQDAVVTANEANRAKSEFLSRMSHDMRTPMNAILGMINLAKAENNPPKTIEYLNNIDNSSHFLLGLINDVLDISKIESGKINLSEEPFSFSEFADNINNVIRPLMDQKNIEFIFDIPSEHKVIIVDKLRLMQIFFNLLSNAAKYTPSGGHVEFTMSHIPDKNGKYGMRYVIRDNGIGMSSSFQKIVFDPFSQEQRSGNTEIQGSGLGLAIVKNLVEAMGGKIKLNSSLEKGSEFIVDLYAVLKDETELESMKNIQDDYSFNGLHILLVEDNALNIMVAESFLERKGFITDVAVNGQEAVEKFCSSKKGFYCAVLMDIRMPVMNGLDATQAIRALKRKDASCVPIIAMTADAFIDDQNKTVEVGMNAHITKPIEPDVLYSTLAGLIRK